MLNGFYYVKNYLSNEEIKNLTNYCKTQNLLKPIGKTAKSRRVAQFGYTYAYDRSGISEAEKMPAMLKDIIAATRVNKSVATNVLADEMEQLIINEYVPGQGIAQHTDNEKYFGPVIACITLGSAIEIEFINKTTGQSIKKYVEVGSLYIMSGDSRYKWTHGIAARSHDDSVKRNVRYSLTYRTVLADAKKVVSSEKVEI